MKNSAALIVIAFILVSCAGSSSVNNYPGSDKFNTTYVKSNLEFLASDELEGREATSDAEKVASMFIATELKKYGLLPYGDDGSYFQNINFSAKKLDTTSNIIFYGDIKNDTLRIGEELATQPYKNFNEEYMNKPLPVLFGGYGITAEEFGYDDYTDVSPEGKIVIILSGEPYSENPEFFNGSENSKYSSPLSKVETAKNKGAAAVLIVPSDEYNSYWSILASRSTSEALGVQNVSEESGIPVAMISQQAVGRILTDQENTYELVKKTIEEKDIPRAFELNKKASVGLSIQSNAKSGRNVVALLPGNKPELENEIITIGAHYDHVGIMHDEIYNGADDNGSGTVTVLETARMLSELHTNDRPIVFLFYTAEEKGLLGSGYFVDSCGYTDKIITNINIDMTGRNSIDTIFCLGSDHISKEFDDIVKLANAESVNYFLDYSLSNTRLFRQSDHYSYAQKDIPVVFFFDNMMDDLHKPEDDVHKINFKKICKTAHLVTSIALRVTNLDHKLQIDNQ